MVSQTSQNDQKTTPKATPNVPHKIRLFLRIVPFRCVPLIFLGCMLSPSWVYVGYVGLMFAYCKPKYCTKQHYNVLYYDNYTMLYYAILYYIQLCYTILFHNNKYYSIICHKSKQTQLRLQWFYQHMHLNIQNPRCSYADLRHEVCGAGFHACVFNMYIYNQIN